MELYYINFYWEWNPFMGTGKKKSKGAICNVSKFFYNKG